MLELSNIKKREDSLPEKKNKVEEEKEKYKAKNGQDPDPNDKRTNFSKALTEYNWLKNKIEKDKFEKLTIHKILGERPSNPPPEMNPEIPTTSKGVEEDIRTVVGSSGLTREQLEGLTVDKLVKGKEKVKEEMEYIEPKAEQLDILKKIPQAQQTGEIKRDIKELEKDAFGIEKLQAVYESYKSELERRGIKEESTQTDQIISTLEQAKYLARKYPTLYDTIMNIFIKNILEKGNIEDIKNVEEFIPKESPFYHKVYNYIQEHKPEKEKSSLKNNVVSFSFINQKYKYWD